MRAFVAVAQERSFTRAAERLCLSQPALTLLIQQLERALGVRLLDRNTRSVELTDAGREFQAAVLRVLSDVDATVEGLRDLAARRRGRVSVAALPSVAASFLPEAIMRFRAGHPEVKVAVRDALAEIVVACVRSGEADLGVTMLPASTIDIATEPLFEDRLDLVCRQDDALASRPVVAWRDLVGRPLVAMTPDTSVRAMIDRSFAEVGHVTAPVFEASYMATAVAMVRCGLGVTILPSTTLPVALQSETLHRPLEQPVASRTIGIVLRRGRSLSPAAEGFAAQLRRHAAADSRLPADGAGPAAYA